MSPHPRRPIFAQDSQLSPLSFAPPALESPSRFASRAPASVPPRRARRAAPRIAAALAVAVVLATAVHWASWAAWVPHPWGAH